MAKSDLLRVAFFGLVFLLGLQNSWAENIAIEAIKSYGLSPRVADLDEWAANTNAAWQQNFDRCMAGAQGKNYWYCLKYRVAGKGPADNNSGFTNGEPNSYKILLERDINTK